MQTLFRMPTRANATRFLASPHARIDGVTFTQAGRIVHVSGPTVEHIGRAVMAWHSFDHGK